MAWDSVTAPKYAVPNFDALRNAEIGQIYGGYERHRPPYWVHLDPYPTGKDAVPSGWLKYIDVPDSFVRPSGSRTASRFNYRSFLPLILPSAISIFEATCILAKHNDEQQLSRQEFIDRRLRDRVSALRGFAAAVDACVVSTRPVTLADDQWAFGKIRRDVGLRFERDSHGAWSYVDINASDDSPEGHVYAPISEIRPGNSIDGWPVGAWDTCTNQALIAPRWRPPAEAESDVPLLTNAGYVHPTAASDNWYKALEVASRPVIDQARRVLLKRAGYYALMDVISTMETVMSEDQTKAPIYLCRNPTVRPILSTQEVQSVRERVEGTFARRDKAQPISLRAVLQHGRSIG